MATRRSWGVASSPRRGASSSWGRSPRPTICSNKARLFVGRAMTITSTPGMADAQLIIEKHQRPLTTVGRQVVQRPVLAGAVADRLGPAEHGGLVELRVAAILGRVRAACLPNQLSGKAQVAIGRGDSRGEDGFDQRVGD